MQFLRACNLRGDFGKSMQNLRATSLKLSDRERLQTPPPRRLCPQLVGVIGRGWYGAFLG